MRSRDAWSKAIGTAAVAIFFVGGYFGVGTNVSAEAARGLGTAFDSAVPFLPWTVWVYLAVFPMAFLPLFLVRSATLFARTMAAYAAVMAISYLFFVLFPVTSVTLRADPASLDATRFSEWAVRTVYRLDPPYNLFPSLHLSVAMLAALSAWKVRRSWGIVAFASAGLIGVSICTVKQHFVVDGLAGVALALAAYAAIVRPYRPAPGERVGHPAGAWVLYLGLLALMYAGFAVLFGLS